MHVTCVSYRQSHNHSLSLRYNFTHVLLVSSSLEKQERERDCCIFVVSVATPSLLDLPTDRVCYAHTHVAAATFDRRRRMIFFSSVSQSRTRHPLSLLELFGTPCEYSYSDLLTLPRAESRFCLFFPPQWSEEASPPS